jgi:hypothetical protein
VQLHYIVCGAFDELNLHYDLEAIEMNGESRERLCPVLEPQGERGELMQRIGIDLGTTNTVAAQGGRACGR